jgi:phosphoglycolate phosphatase-like HAD superfamily hydrolase
MKDLLVAWDFNGVLNAFGDEAEAVLLHLQAHGAEQIIVSSSTTGTIEQYLQAHGLDQYISQIYGYVPASLQWVGDASVMKEEFLKRHLHKFGPYQKTVLVGDAESDVRAGKKVNAMTILYSPNQPTFETTADKIVHHPKDITDLLLPEHKDSYKTPS